MDFLNGITSYFMGLSSVELSYLFVVLFMFTLAVVDLTVGVSNDAVNFLSAAVGSKAAKIKHAHCRKTAQTPNAIQPSTP